LLAKKDLLRILIEGGPRVLGSALNERLVDKIQIYMAPKIIGDQDALSAVQGRKVSDVHQAITLDQVEIKRIGEDILLEGRVIYH
jgi:diaminohydroxyphosphoribosylaminopyrimidine deaminase/5-amino-6-(5-phosphoribosylamino)uracil reductase